MLHVLFESHEFQNLENLLEIQALADVDNDDALIDSVFFEFPDGQRNILHPIQRASVFSDQHQNPQSVFFQIGDRRPLAFLDEIRLQKFRQHFHSRFFLFALPKINVELHA